MTELLDSLAKALVGIRAILPDATPEERSTIARELMKHRMAVHQVEREALKSKTDQIPGD